MADERPPALTAWTDLSAVAAESRGAVNRALQEAAGLSLAENLVLCEVAMSPGAALRMADIAGILGVAKSAVTKTVDRLEARGWVVRTRDDTDRRTVFATLTPAGQDAFRRAQPIFVTAVRGEFEGRLTKDELALLQRLLSKLAGHGNGHRDAASNHRSAPG